jgi:hypothetical protein
MVIDGAAVLADRLGIVRAIAQGIAEIRRGVFALVWEGLTSHFRSTHERRLSSGSEDILFEAY